LNISKKKEISFAALDAFCSRLITRFTKHEEITRILSRVKQYFTNKEIVIEDILKIISSEPESKISFFI
jgi:hypothetical protein